jgi:phosphoribosylglycinamide formyltransferase 1
MLTIGVMISGSGSNLQAMIDAIDEQSLPIKIGCVISNKAEAYGLIRAQKHQIPAYAILPKEYPNRESHEKAVIDIMNQHAVKLVALAGYMRVLTPYFVHYYTNRLINIHPALLPAFPGAHGIQEAFDYGVKVTGVTVHFVDEGVDSGPIIEQVIVPIVPEDTLESLEAKIHREEHLLYPKVLGYFADDRIRLDGRKVNLLPR